MEPTSSGFDNEPKANQKAKLHPLTLLGFPTEKEIKRFERFPFATIGVIFASLVLSLWFFLEPEFWEYYILKPSDLVANSGFNIFVSMFLFNDWIRLAGNCIFSFLVRRQH